LLFEIPPYPFKFSAESGIMTEPNGLCYIGDSYYDPAVGRFLNEAPLLAVAGINSFAFAGNNPLNPIAAIPAISPALYAGANVYKASKAGDEKEEGDDGGEKGKGKKGKDGDGEKAKWWQYYTKGWKKFKSKWFVKGIKGKPPYKLGKEAREALNLPPENEGTAVQPYNPKKIVGPRTPKPKPKWKWPNPGKGKEYYDGDAFPD
jgi:RHS repeat-associated protein